MRKLGIYRRGGPFRKDLLQSSRTIILARIKQFRILLFLVFGLVPLGLSGCYFEPPGYYGDHEYRGHHHHHDHDY